MKRFRAIPALCLGFGLAAIGWVHADDKTGDEAKEHETAKTVLEKAKIDLSKAIEAAQAKLAQGKPIQANTANEDGKQLFEVFFLVGDSVSEVEVDAATGAVVKVEENEDDEIEDLKDAKKVLAAAKITFAQAIATAKEKVKDGKPFECEMEIDDDKSIIAVELLAGDKVMEVEIDAVSGKVLAVEEQ